MKTFLLFLLGIGFSTVAVAQLPPVQFKTKTANYGKVQEEAGTIAYDFYFTNKGSDPLRIEKVVPSCGCTATEYTQLAIPTDSMGKIKVSYNTTNRPGEINKTVSVYFHGYPQPEVLSLKGSVVGTQRLIERELVYPVGNLRFQSRTLNLGTVKTNRPENRDFEFYNAGTKTIEITRAIYDSTFLKIMFSKNTLKPKESAHIRITYNALARKDWGLCHDSLHLYTNDEFTSLKILPITAHIEEYFPPLDASTLTKAPKLKFEKADQHLGSVREGNSVSHVFKFTNEGQEDLVIRKIVPGCNCITYETPKYVIKSGEISYIRVTMNSKDREGVQNKNITVISNSPSSPTINLWIRLNVN